MATEQIEFNLYDYFPQAKPEVVIPAVFLTAEPEPTAAKGRKTFSTDVGEILIGARKHFAEKFSKYWYEQIEADPSRAGVSGNLQRRSS